MTPQTQMAKMIDLHKEYVDNMLAIADRTGNKEILDTTIAHLESLQAILKPKPAVEHTTEYQQYDRENNPSLHRGS
jgi:hypothetical protein